MNQRTPFLSLVLGGALVATLAGCTSDPSTPPPTASPSKGPAAVTKKCVDGFMLIDADALDAKKALAPKEDCATVSIVGSNSMIELGAVDTIVFEGNGNKVDVDSVRTVRLAGNDNELKHSSPGAPDVDDKGTGNTVAAK